MEQKSESKKKECIGNRMTITRYFEIMYSKEVQKLNNPDYIALRDFLKSLIPNEVNE